MTDSNKTKCPICGKLLGELRLKRYPRGATCGFKPCATQHRRNQQNKIRNRHYAKRYAGDPAFRERELSHGREQYRVKRLAEGKTVVPRARPAAQRGAIDTFLSAIRRGMLGALTRSARAFVAFCGG